MNWNPETCRCFIERVAKLKTLNELENKNTYKLLLSDDCFRKRRISHSLDHFLTFMMASEFEVKLEDLDEKFGDENVKPFTQEDDDGPPMPILKPISLPHSQSKLDLESLNELMQRKMPKLVIISKMGDEVEMEQIISQGKTTGEEDAYDNLSPPELYRFDELNGKLDDWTECSPPVLLPCYLEGLEAELAVP